MGETRVNLRHLLENLRDSYPIPLEEAIVTELVANSLDSKASEIRFSLDSKECSLTIVDNGMGMKRGQFESYHDIAETTKVKGEGIGFAGQGAKLSLLAAKEVCTETETSEGHYATKWHLENDFKAPWDFVTPWDLITTQAGTAVKVFLHEGKNELLNSSFVILTVQKWFSPLLEKRFMTQVIKEVYPKGITFSVNGKVVELPQKPGLWDFLKGNKPKAFQVRLGVRKKPVGTGFLRKTNRDLDEDERGLAISVLGKVVKCGWEWVGLSPREPKRIWGIVEVPGLSAILTTNKCDFRQDVTSKQKYYQYRKAIAIAIEPVLRSLGELSEVERGPVPPALEKQVQRVLEKLLPDFPELGPLMGRWGRGEKVTTVLADPAAPLAGSLKTGVDVVTGDRGGAGQGGGLNIGPGQGPGERIDPDTHPVEPGRKHNGRRRPPGLLLDYKNLLSKDLGQLRATTVVINTGHPAFKKTKGEKNLATYHAFFAVSWVLSKNLAAGRSPQDFISSFLGAWGVAHEG